MKPSELLEKRGFVKVGESIQEEIKSGPAWRRPPDPGCRRCKGTGMEGKIVCHCVTKANYSPKNTIND